MDAELREYLDSRFAGLETRFTGIETRFTGIETRFAEIETRFQNLNRLLEDTKESLEREIGQVRELMTEIQRRLDRQAGLIQTGARHTTRMIRWSEQVDQSLEDLKARVQDLERKRRNGNA